MNISIGNKILGMFVIVAILSVGAAILSYRGTTELIISAEWRSHTYQVLDRFNEILSLLKDAETGQRGFLVTGENRYIEPYNGARNRIEQALADARKLTEDNPRQQSRLDSLRSLIDQKFSELAETISARKEKGFDAARKIVLTDQGRSIMDQIRRTVGEAENEEKELLLKRDEETKAYAASTKLILVLGGAVCIIMVFVMMFFVRTNIVEPLGEVVRMANGIASGNLKQEKLSVRSRDEIGELASVFNAMVLSLRDLASQNIAVAKDLGSAASEVLASIKQQGAAVREQVTAIHQTTTTMDEIGQSGTQVAEKAKQVVTAAEATSNTGSAGISAVKDTNQTMFGIRSQVESVAENIVSLSQRNQTIGEIIASVTDIAEQSNLLALNAAIEAAGAGESGRRFSIVANEIKNLADQAKSATIQIRSILSEIQKGINSSVMLTEEAVKRAESGKQQAEVAEQTIRQLTDTTQESIRTFQQIVGATGQQQIGFDQIAQALKGIRLGAEQTAASTNQLEKAAMSMNSLGVQLQKSVERYQI